MEPYLSHAQYYDEDEDLPVWIGQARTFVDLRHREAQYFNDILDHNLPDRINRWDCDEENGWTFEFDDLVLEVLNNISGPMEVKATSWSMPRTYIDPLRRSLRHLLSAQLDNLYGVTDFAVLLLRLVEEANIALREWKGASSGKAVDIGWDLTAINSGDIRNLITSNAQGANLDTIETTADDLLGTSIKKICERLPEQYRILHVEPVFRTDLVTRFKRRQYEIYEDLLKRPYNRLRQCVSSKAIARGSSLDKKKHLAEELSRPRVTFHGIQRHNVSSIVRYGFVKPGDKAGDTQIDVACGASFGIGVYTSPSAEYALMYAGGSDSGFGHKTSCNDLPGLRLIVCAVLMGLPVAVTREETWRTTEISTEIAHSHVSPNEQEYVVFNAAQVIPCYVIHFDFGVEFAKAELAKVPVDPNRWSRQWRQTKSASDRLLKSTYVAPAEVAAAKQARKAAAAKWFPYGFGPATGTSFVIEEIGEISDDEEDYGDYQGMRIEVEDEVSVWEETVTGGSSWFDEYQTSRTTYRKT
ncbi:uncharacterized protein LY89DRAFT_776002 [Mollisia scopiformis]|uniref:Uncharacterized protein n=1 Tax=Mollisia scopiformis TaxID=149040 RepID=A0A194XU62_MOLSC|nr:uncharacterized protein LY89DRAFT_776002 [Mollisia scopiformis]KUJ23748.1 hypothetical protein LY89DRAFT_776002 [Mollisia scopiformis]